MKIAGNHTAGRRFLPALLLELPTSWHCVLDYLCALPEPHIVQVWPQLVHCADVQCVPEPLLMGQVLPAQQAAAAA
jgi:hypothetical protein